jgi:hypothetical protein
MEFIVVETAGYKVDTTAVCLIQRNQIRFILRALGDHRVGIAHEPLLDIEALVGETVVCALMQAPYAPSAWKVVTRGMPSASFTRKPTNPT